jgi:hypothetical protein
MYEDSFVRSYVISAIKKKQKWIVRHGNKIIS